MRIDNVEIPAYFFEELQDIFVGGLGGVDFKGAAIFAFGLVEEEIDNWVVDFLFHLVFGS